MQPIPSPLPNWISFQGTRVLLQIWAQPGAKKTEIVGEYNGCLKIKIQAPPVEGAANVALLAFLAQKLHLRKNQLCVEKGETTRKKWISCADITPETVYSALSI